jgi:ribosomal protein L24
MVKNISVVSSIDEIYIKHLEQIESLYTTKDSETLEPKSDVNSQKGEGLGMFNNFRAHLNSDYMEKMKIKEMAIAINEENQTKDIKKEYTIINNKVYFTDPAKQKQHEERKAANLQHELERKERAREKAKNGEFKYYNNVDAKYERTITSRGMRYTRVA